MHLVINVTVMAFLSYLSLPAVSIKVFLTCNRWSEHSFEIYLEMKPC